MFLWICGRKNLTCLQASLPVNRSLFALHGNRCCGHGTHLWATSKTQTENQPESTCCEGTIINQKASLLEGSRIQKPSQTQAEKKNQSSGRPSADALLTGPNPTNPTNDLQESHYEYFNRRLPSETPEHRRAMQWKTETARKCYKCRGEEGAWWVLKLGGSKP